MQYTITISGRQTGTGNYSSTVSASQLNMVLTIDKTLDYGSFVVRNQNPEPFEVGDMVDIDITDGVDTESYHFIVSADDVTQFPNGNFVHNVAIIELTKILEWQSESVRTFTQAILNAKDTDETFERPLDLLDVVTRLQFSIPLSPTADLATTRAFALDNTLRTRLASVVAPEFQFNNRNLKEMLFEIFDFIGAIPRLIKVGNNLVLTADFYNERGQLVTTDSFYRMKRLDINDFSTSLNSDIKNIYDQYTSITEPAPGKFKFLTSEVAPVKEDNAIIQTEYPIVEIESLKIKFPLRAGYLNFIPDAPIDITEFIVEKEEWDTLKNLKFAQSNFAGQVRDNTLFYTRYEKDIKGLFAEAGVIKLQNRLNFLLSAALQRDGVPIQAVGEVIVDYRDVEFQITYKAILDSRVQAKRMDTINIKYDSQLPRSQSSNIVRADRALDRLFKLQQLLGNASVMTSERITELGDLYHLGDFKDDDFIITTIEMICDKNHINVKYMFSQNYQKVSEFIDVDSEVRLENIPARTFRRDIYIENFVEVDTVAKPNTSFVTPAGIQTFANTIAPIPSATHNTPVGLLTFNNEDNPSFQNTKDPNTGLNTRVVVKPQSAFTGGNSINFHSEFDNAKIAGFQVDSSNRDNDTTTNIDQLDESINTDNNLLQIVGDAIASLFSNIVEFLKDVASSLPLLEFRTPPELIGINYSDRLGRVFDCDFQFVQGANFDPNDSKFLPVILKTEIVRPLVTVPKHTIFKDIRENLAITYGLHVLPIKGLENRIVIGKYLVERNNLLKGISTALNQFEVFTSSQPYSVTENAFSRSTDTVSALTYSVVPYEVDSVTSGFIVATSQAIAKEVTWGIRKKDTRELVFVVNPGDVSISANNPPSSFPLYFTFRQKQSFVQYPNQSAAPVVGVARPVNIQLIPPSNNPTDSTIEIVWQDGNVSPASDNFEIGISTNFRDFDTVLQAPATTNSFKFENLTSNTEHLIRIRAFVGNNFSEYAFFSATTLIDAPNVPSALTATLLSERRILLSWTEEDDDIFLYRIEASENSNFTPLIQGGLQQSFFGNTTAVFDFLNADIDYNTQYFFRVRALRAGQFSGFSASANITTGVNPATSPPTITNISVSGSNVTFTLVNTDDQLVTLFADFATATTSRATSVRPNEARTFTLSFTSSDSKIFAKAKAALKDNSAVVNQQFVAEFAPSAPSISAITSQVGRNLIDWTYSGEIVTGFVLERNPNFLGGATFGVLSDTIPAASRTFVDTRNIDSQTTYTYRIRAFNRAGEATSTTSSVTTIAMIPAAPSSLANQQVQTISGSSASVVLTWQRNSTDETGFVIEWRETSTMANFIQIDGAAAGATTAYVIFDRIGSGTKSYLFRVRAVNQFGQSAPSNESLVLI
jgi:hypothetical protein